MVPLRLNFSLQPGQSGIEFDLLKSDKSVNKIHPNKIKII